MLCDSQALEVADFPQIAQAMGVAAGRVAPGMLQPAAPGEAASSAPATSPVDGISALDPAGSLRPLADVESDMIRYAIKKYSGRMSEVARRLGIGRSTLYRKVRELGLEVREEA